MALLGLVIAIILSISCKEMSLVLGDIGTATSYDPPYTPTKCNGNRQDQFPSGNLFVQVSEGLWDNGAACGRRYRLRCLSGSNKPCKQGTVDVRVVDFCSRRPCPSTIVMSNDAFAAVSRSSDAKINIEFVQYVEKIVSFAANAVDHRGSPADKSKTGGWLPATLILGIEFCERLSTMGIAVNLVTYLIGTMHLPSATSANTVTDFMGTSFLLCLLGGFLADSFLGRYKTVAIFASIQTLGTALLAISTHLPQLRPPPCHSQTICKQATTSQMAMLYASLYVIALGTGGLKSSVSGFGTDQFDENDENEKPQMNLFFGRFFFLVSLGTLLAVTGLVYVQDEVGRSLSYGICSISMLIAILIFLGGTRKYRYKRTTGSPIVHILQVIVGAVKKRGVEVPKDVNLLYETSLDGSLRVHHTDQFKFLDKAAIIRKEDYGGDNSNMPPNPWTLSSVTKVEEVKMMIRLLPVWATTIIFWTTYAQMITFSVEQASTMDRNIGGFQIPAGSLTVFFVAAILISLAAYDRLIIPFMKKWFGKPGFTNLQRIGIGLFLSTLGMAAAALAEKKRLSKAKEQLARFDCEKVTTGGGGGGKGWVGDRINDGRLDCFYGLLAVLSFVDFWLFLLSAAWYRSKTATRKDLKMGSVGKGEEKC
ncbi:hypothetical protein DH2020_046643 [Rehmannia glutinosa]|uniref:Expansin-like EG45 domain-containing protein n=1 Tax=Rehmannia glutinosa TaxID=99300 RepID=A0ABR0UBT1_REHGL